jgi:hypothetical protein
MRAAHRAAALAIVLLTAVPGLAQSPPAATPRPVRVILASGRLASVVEAPLYFHMVRVTIPAGLVASRKPDRLEAR